MKHSWTIEPMATRIRLDVFLTQELPELTRSHIAKLLKNDTGTVNGKATTVHAFLKPGDKVTFEDTMPDKVPLARKTPPKLQIIDETDDYVVVNKPPGLLTHPDGRTAEATLVDSLIKHCPAIGRVGEDPERPGIMHRLDKEASGVMVVAKNQKTFDALKQQFAEHSVQKKYRALAYGEIREDEGDLKFRIARSKTQGRMAARPENAASGKAAWTHFRVIERLRHATLLELDIFSGRTHQIRAHLFAFNHSIIGDPLYKRRAAERSTIAPRLMLQAIHLSFKDPETGEQKTYELPMDPAFKKLMSEM